MDESGRTEVSLLVVMVLTNVSGNDVDQWFTSDKGTISWSLSKT